MEFATSDILLFILSVSAVIITAVIVIGAYTIFGIVREVQDLLRSVRVEFESLRSKRREFELRGRTLIKLLKVLGGVTAVALRKKL